MKKSDKRKFKNVKFKNEFSLLDIYKAYWDCRKNKRTTEAAIQFEFNLETNIAKLYEDLKNGKYKIGKSICFVVLKPKPREVWAADFRDRIVHHFVYNIIKDRFYSSFIKDTYSCIPKRGTLLAAKQLARYTQAVTDNYSKKAYYLKADIRNFFVSIDKKILFDIVKDRVPEKWLCELIEQIIFNNPKENAVIQSPKWKFKLLPFYKSLWGCDELKGLPIGNLTSQFFSNVYLNKLDQFVKNKLKCKYYCRYVDDFVILDESPEKLNKYHREITEFLIKELKLELHQNKKTINLVQNGINFVGYKIKPNRIFLRQKTLRAMFRNANNFRENIFDVKEEALEYLFCLFNSYLGQLTCVKGYNIRKKLCAKIVFPFFCNDENYTKVRKMYVPEKHAEYLKFDEQAEG